MRILAGASYLDMIWYRVHVDHVMSSIVFLTLHAIDDLIDNIKFLFTEAECRAAANDWNDVQIQRHKAPSIEGLISAGDGVVAWITQPGVADLQGRNVDCFWNRKGFYGVVCQAFCDSIRVEANQVTLHAHR